MLNKVALLEEHALIDCFKFLLHIVKVVGLLVVQLLSSHLAFVQVIHKSLQPLSGFLKIVGFDLL